MILSTLRIIVSSKCRIIGPFLVVVPNELSRRRRNVLVLKNGQLIEYATNAYFKFMKFFDISGCQIYFG